MAEGVPLHSLLPARLDSLPDRVRDRLCEDEQVGGMKLAWDFIGKELHHALQSVLNRDLLELLAETWARAPALAALADPAASAPGERRLIELGEHDVTHQLQPVIAVTIGACPCVELAFTFDVSAHVGGVRLAVVDGHIVGGDLGELSANGQLSFQGVPLHPAAETRKLAIPAEFALAAPGVAIPLLA